MEGSIENNLIESLKVVHFTHLPKRFVIHFEGVQMFGPRHTIPAVVATSELPEWVEKIRLIMSVDCSGKYPFRPHVSIGPNYVADDKIELSLFTTSIALMHKKEVLHEWHLL